MMMMMRRKRRRKLKVSHDDPHIYLIRIHRPGMQNRAGEAGADTNAA